MTAVDVALSALEVWRASGRRTEERRAALIDGFIEFESYFSARAWSSDDIRALAADALIEAKRRTLIWELQYD